MTAADNVMLSAPPDKDEVYETVQEANHRAAPGKDGITSLVYKLCWSSMGDTLTAVAKAKFEGETFSENCSNGLWY